MKRLLLAGTIACGGTTTPIDPPVPRDDPPFSDLAALYGARQGIYRGCAPNEGVCHNNAEYPELSTLGGVLLTVGAACNRSRDDPADRHDLCEARGDVLVAGDRRAEIGWAEVDGMTLRLKTERPVPAHVGDTVTVAGQPFEVMQPPRRKVFVLRSRSGQVVAPRGGDSNRNGVFGASLQGALVAPGDPLGSYLIRRLVDPAAGPVMPRANCCGWTKETLRATWCWIAGLDRDGSNALEPIDYERCPPGPEEAIAYPKPGRGCATSGMCPVQPKIERGETPTWDAVYGLLSSRCGGRECHGAGAPNELDVATEAAARETLTPFITAGAPARSELYRRVTPNLADASGLERMPLGADPLTLAERELIRAYIASRD